MRPYLELNSVTKTYDTPKGRAIIVSDFDLFVQKGEFVSIIGHSGCGKSTVLSMIAGLNAITRGGIVLNGQNIDGPGPDRGVVFQAPCLLPWLSAVANVRFGVDQVRRDATREERTEIALGYLERVGLGSTCDRYPAELSAGMRQRVGIARAFALDPALLLLDEPFGMLDSITRLELQEVLLEVWSRDQKTAVMVTHDVDEALYLSDRIVLMTNGPQARVGGIVDVPFPRPRDRRSVLDHPQYYPLRESLLAFLEEQASPREALHHAA